MRDRDIRAALHELLDARHAGDPETLIVDELGVCEGEVRVDLAVINGALAGFEIKSDADTLARLPRQREAYERVFDYLTLIVGPKRLDVAAEAISPWWGLVVAEPSGLCEVRQPARNTAVDPHAVAQLLWRDEALELLAARGLDRGLRSKPRRMLWDALADHIPLEELAEVVREVLKLRADWRAVA